MPTEKKIQAIAEVGSRREDEDTLRQVALKYCVSRDTLSRWIINEELLLNRRAKELGMRRENLPAAAPIIPRTSPKRPLATAVVVEEPEVTASKRSCQRLPSPISDVSPTSSGCRASPNSPPSAPLGGHSVGGPSSHEASRDVEHSWPPAERPPFRESAERPPASKDPTPHHQPPVSSPHQDFDDLSTEKATADLLRFVFRCLRGSCAPYFSALECFSVFHWQ